MSTMRDAPVLKAVAEVIREHVGKAFAFLQVRIDDIEQRFKELPQPIQGPPGPQGAIGPSGKDGAAGEQGIAGPSGADGKPGKDGDRGADGIAGEPGKDGRDGIDGAKGNDGASGKDGANGRDGIDGKDGSPGIAGKDGANGLNGKDGASGIDGKSGADGLNGKDGRDGIDGKNGADGIQGKDGRDGIDAPLVDVEALTASVTEKVLKQIPAPIAGKDGASVDLEAVRVLIAGEVTKAVSALPKPPAGRDGRDGRQGEPGRDALDLDIQPEIDESMSYQRGVLAEHRNGLFRAYRTTDPVENNDYEAAGWRCIYRGVYDIVQSLGADQRTVVTSYELSDGKLITSSFTTPTMIHKGTFKEGTQYSQGDTVTLGGSTWHANATTTDRPGTSKAWTLAVKRGSDGKDLRSSEDELNGTARRSVYLSAPKS